MTLSGFKEYSKQTNGAWFIGTLVAARLFLGFQFLLAGIDKFGGWSAEGYLLGATGPFAGFFQSLAGNALVDQLNIWGLTLIGVALILGFMVRPASIGGAALMLLYYFAHFVQNTEHGILEYHLFYVIIFVLFLAGGAGHVFGLDGLVSRNMRKKKKGFVKWIFG